MNLSICNNILGVTFTYPYLTFHKKTLCLLLFFLKMYGKALCFLKGVRHEIFSCWFFHESVSPFEYYENSQMYSNVKVNHRCQIKFSHKSSAIEGIGV
jgi:hypothetical protein